MLRFSAHLGYLFLELPFEKRAAAARRAGFTAIEHPAPYGVPAAALKRLLDEEGLAFVQLALPAGDAAKGEKGFAACPGRQREFRESVEIGLDYAGAAGARFVHVQSGTTPVGHEWDLSWDTYLMNLAWTCERAERSGVQVLIEPIGPGSLENYFLSRMPLAVEAIRAVKHPHLKLLYDVFHGRCAGEDPAAVIREHAGIIGHIQIADFPGRHEPGTGTTRFEEIFSVLSEVSWPGFVGCEYKPSSTTESSLAWLSHHRRSKSTPCASGSRVP